MLSATQAQPQLEPHIPPGDVGHPDISTVPDSTNMSLDHGLGEEEWELLQFAESIDSRLDGSDPASYTTTSAPPDARSRRPKCMIILPPPSESMLRKRTQYGFYRKGSQIPLEMMGEACDDDTITDSDSDSDSPEYYDLILEDASGRRTVTREYLEASKRCADGFYNIDALRVGKLAWSDPWISKARTEQFYGRLPMTGAAPMVLANENERRRQRPTNTADTIDNEGSTSPALRTLQGDITATQESSQWLDDWKKGKEEVRERLRAMYETGDRRASYCKRVL